MPEITTGDLLKAGIPLLMDERLLEVTTFKKKFADQLLVLTYGELCDICREGRAKFAGRLSDTHVIVRTMTGFNKVRAGDWVAWRKVSRYADEVRDMLKTDAEVSRIVRAEFLALPQLFLD